MAIGGGVGVGVGDPDADGFSTAADVGVTVDAGIVVEVGDGVREGTEATGLGTELVLEQAMPVTRRKARTEAIRSRCLRAKLRGSSQAGRKEASVTRSSSYGWLDQAVKDTL